jgi:hypothetical protein
MVVYTLATFRSVAGLPEDGFRRATAWNGVDDPTWSYGVMQAGDIIGPWIFEDLQAAFDALRWTHYVANRTFPQFSGPAESPLSHTESEKVAHFGSGSGTTWLDAHTDAADDWATSGGFGGDFFYWVDVSVSASPSGALGLGMYREQSDCTFTQIPQHIDHEAFLYYGDSGVMYQEIPPQDGASVFSDLDAAGLIPHPALTLMKSFAGGNESSHVLESPGGASPFPFGTIDALDKPEPQASAVAWYYGTDVEAATIVLKWEFSHTL